MTMFNLGDVNSRAEQALVKNMSNPEESRQIYLEEIMDWTDNYTENKLELSQSDEAKSALSAIVRLWIAFCTMEISLRQFKQAVKIFEDAITDPIASRSADIYLAYVDYCKTRGKLANAQKVYIKGLSASLLQEEADKLWRSFLPFLQSQGSPDLSMSQLYEAVRSEAGVDSLTPPGSSAAEEGHVKVGSEPTTDTTLATQIDSTHSNNNSNTSQNPVDTEASSRMILEESFIDAECKTEDASHPLSSIDLLEKQPVDTDEGIVIKQEKIVPIKLVDESAATEGEMTALVKGEDDYKMLVSADDVLTVSVSAVGALVLDTTVNPGGAGDDLDVVAGMTPEQLTRIHRLRPPMLFSAPNKEPTVFGLSPLSPTDIAELEAFLGVGLDSIRYGVRQGKADTYLDIVEGLWTAQALKERHFDSWFTDLKKLHEKEGRDLSRTCEDKEKEASSAGAPAILIAKEKNQADRKRFRSRCAVQREVLHAAVNKTVYALLMDQQQALVAAEFPRFTPAVVERIQVAMVALKSGEGPLSSAVSAGQSGSIFEPSLMEDLAGQRRIMCALLSLRVNLVPAPQNKLGGTSRRDGPIDAQGQGQGQGGHPLMRGSSVGSDFYSGGRNGKSDYYSQDAKQQRKAKRRKLYPAEGGDEIRFDDRRVRPDNIGRQGGQGQAGFQGQGQGPDNRRGPVRRGAGGRGPMGNNNNNNSSSNNSQQQNTRRSNSPIRSASLSAATTGEETAPLNLLQKLATMIQKVTK